MNPQTNTAQAAAHMPFAGEAASAPLSLTPIDDQPVVVMPPHGVQPQVSADSLLQFAMAKGADLDYIQRLIDMRNQWREEQRREAYFAALAAFAAEDVVIMKDQHVEFKTRDGDTTSYDHADLDDVNSAIKPKLAKHGLSIKWSERVEGKTVWCTATVRHALGYQESSEPLPGPFDNSGKKNPIQEMASTITYLRRYTAMGILGLSAKGHDNDGRGATPGYLGAQGGEQPAGAADAKPSVVESFAACKSIPELSRVMNALSMPEKKQFQAAFNDRRNELKRGAQ